MPVDFNISIMKKLLLFFAALCCTLAVSAQKAYKISLEKYDLLINNVQVTSLNSDDPLGQNTSDRYVKYDRVTNTLTLYNVYLTCEDSNADVIAYFGKEPLNICVRGWCLLGNYTSGCAVRSDYADEVRIYGDGTLFASSSRGGGILIDGNLTVSDGVTLQVTPNDVDVKTFGISLYGDGVLTVDNATVEAKGNPSIWNVKNLVMKNGVNILSAGHKFDAAKKAVVDASGNATNELVKIGVGTLDAIQNVASENTSQNSKFVRNNQLIIKRNGVYYNANGVKVEVKR